MKNVVNSNLNRQILKTYGFKANRKKILKEFDLLITCSGFEERTIGLLNKLNSKTSFKKSIIFVYKPKEESLYLKNLENLGKLRKLLSLTNNKNCLTFNIDPSNPWEFRMIVNSMLESNKINENSSVLLDITSFTRIFLYEIINSLNQKNCQFTISYTEPYDYAEILPTGISQILISPSFPGRPTPTKKSILLLFLGWETGRTFSFYESYNADETIPVLGICPIDKKHVSWSEKSTMRNRELLSEINNVQYCSTLDLDHILEFISKIYHSKKIEYSRNGEEFFFVISGLGPKIQNLAMSIFSLKFPEIQLAYGVPAYWGSSQSSLYEQPLESRGIGRTFLYGPFTKSKISDFFKK